MILKNPSVSPPSTRTSATVALGGGGARGVAHFGALQAMEEHRIRIDRICGTSIGSLAGGIYAFEGNLEAAQKHVVEYLQSKEFRSKQESLYGASPTGTSSNSGGLLGWYDRIKSYLWAQSLLNRVFTRRSLLSGQFLEDVVEVLLPDIDIAETVIPLSIVAVDLKSGHPVVLEQGSLRKAVIASASIPGIFPPVVWEDKLLCDFGVLDSLPTAIAASYNSDLVLGVDVGPSPEPVEDCESALHVLLRMDEISERLYRSRSHELADILIRPEVGKYQWFDFSDPMRLIEAGLMAGRITLSSAGMMQLNRESLATR
ncbi:MAG: patatin-like phospholipase family protein [Planctomycetota bacterium]